MVAFGVDADGVVGAVAREERIDGKVEAAPEQHEEQDGRVHQPPGQRRQVDAARVVLAEHAPNAVRGPRPVRIQLERPPLQVGEVYRRCSKTISYLVLSVVFMNIAPFLYEVFVSFCNGKVAEFFEIFGALFC